MKKFIALTILLLMLSVGCFPTKYNSVYKQSYPQDQLYKIDADIKDMQELFDVDIPLENWLFEQYETQCGYKIERAAILKPAPKNEILLIFTTTIQIDTTFYEFEVLQKKK